MAGDMVGLRDAEGDVFVTTIGEDMAYHLVHPDRPGKARRGEFDWGDTSAASRRLATAILFHVTEDLEAAQKLTGLFLHGVVKELPKGGWFLEYGAVASWIMATIMLPNPGTDAAVPCEGGDQ